MPSILAPSATILAALFAGFLSLYVHRTNAQRTAAAKFRSALLQAVTGLYPVPSNWPSNIDSHLRGIFPELQQAVAEFRPYVPWHARRSYDHAWFVYRLGQEGREIDKQLYHQYMGFTSPGEPITDPEKTFRINVAGLLAFAGRT